MHMLKMGETEAAAAVMPAMAALARVMVAMGVAAAVTLVMVLAAGVMPATERVAAAMLEKRLLAGQWVRTVRMRSYLSQYAFSRHLLQL